MKKTLLIASLVVFGLLAINSAKAEQPTCDTGYHYEGSLVESQVCNQVCTRKFFNICIRYETKCETISNWVGNCVADEVIVPEEPVVEPIVEPVVEPVVQAYTSNPIVVQRLSYSKIDDYTTSNYAPFSSLYGKIGFLTTLKGRACLGVKYSDKYTRLCEVKDTNTYHLFDLNEFNGLLEITPVMFNWRGDEILGKTFTINK